MNSFNKSFNQAFNPAFQQGAAAYQTAQRDKMQEQIRQKAVLDANNQKVMDAAAQVGANPVMNPDGSLNAAATYALVEKQKGLNASIAQKLALKTANDFKNQSEAERLGIVANQASAPSASNAPSFLRPFNTANEVNQLGISGAPAQPAAKPLAQQIDERQEQERRQRAESDLESRNSVNAMAEYRSLFGVNPTPEEFDNGKFTPAGMKAIGDKKAETVSMQARGVAIRYANEQVKNAGLDPDSPEGKALFADRLSYHTATADEKNAMNDMASMYPDIKPGTPEYLQRLNVRKLYHFGSPAYRNAVSQVGEIYAADPTKQRKEIDRVAALGGFSQPKATDAMQKTLIDWNTLQSNQQKLLGMIAEFDDKYPDSPFSSYVGPIDARTLRANLLVNDRASPAAKDVQKILGFYQGIANQRLKDISGAAVTDGEFQRFLKETGDTENANFLNAVQGWHDSTARKYQSQVGALDSYSFPEGLRLVNGKAPEDWVGYYSQGLQQEQAAPVASDALPSMSAIDAELARRANR